MYILLLLLLLLMDVPAGAETLQVSPDTTISFDIPTGWQRTLEPPAFLVEELAGQIAHEAAEKGATLDREQLLDAAEKRLANNEILLVNPKSRAYLTLDFSHLRQGERPPDQASLELSAKYAGASLEHEDGVSKLKGVVQEVTIAGGGSAFRYDADYLYHEKPRHFSGLIGFAAASWYFAYFTDFLADPRDRERAEQFFNSLSVRSPY